MLIYIKRRESTKRQARGQGLIEYALILALVAIAALLVLGLIGWAAQRNYGIISGALGAKKEVQAGGATSHYIYFDPNQPPRCGYLSTPNVTGMYVLFYTNETPATLTVSTDTGFVTTINPVSGGTDYYAIQPVLASGNHPELCPKSIVIQTSQANTGTTAVSPVVAYSWP